MKRIGMAVVATVVAATAGLFVGATPASAASCTRKPGYTIKDGSVIRGSGKHTDCLSTTTTPMKLQRSRWYGWEDLTSTSIVGANTSKGISYNCSGTGAHTYRVILDWRDGGGTRHVVPSNELRKSC